MVSRRRSAAVRVSAGRDQGSGFVASTEHALIITARHCVADVVDDEPGTVTLYFLDPADWGRSDPAFAERTGMVIARGAAVDDDWAVVRVAGGLPPWAQALELSEGEIADGDAWSTTGYPPALGEIGDDFAGEVEMAAALVKLVDPTAPGRGVSGVSGAPCIIEGRAHGVIARADERNRISTTGRFYAVPFSRVAGDMHRALAAAARPRTAPGEAAPAGPELRFDRDPPFLDQAESCLEGGIGLRRIVEDLLRESADDLQRLARFLARRALVRGITVSTEIALRALIRRPSDACELIELAAAQWFPATSARWLAAQLTSPPPAPRAAALNVGCPDFATLCVRRAGYELNGEPAWHKGRIDVSWLPGIDEDELIGEVTSQLYQRLLGESLGPDDDWRAHIAEVNAELAEWFDPARGRWRLQFVMLPTGAQRSAIERLAATYPAIAVVVRTGGHAIVTADAPLVVPALREAATHMASWRRAVRQVQLQIGDSV